MAGDRKYRQQGYRDSAGQKAERRASPPPPPARDPTAPRPSWVPGNRTVSRCAACGALLGGLTEPTGPCPGCGTAIHACRQCAHFDTGRPFECTEPIEARITNKSAANECARFALRVTIERDVSPGGTRPDEARRAFDNLFGR